MSARGRAIKQLEKKIFYHGLTCPLCGKRLTALVEGRRVYVPDAAPLVDRGCCRECARSKR